MEEAGVWQGLSPLEEAGAWQELLPLEEAGVWQGLLPLEEAGVWQGLLLLEEAGVWYGSLMKGINMEQVTATLISNIEVMPAAHLLWLESPQIASQTQPGQFIMVRCGQETILRRPLSIHQLDGDRIALLFAVVREGTHWLSRCQAGDRIDLLGPLGNGYRIHPDSHRLLLVAGGIGIAPLRFLADKAVEQGKKVTMLLGASTAAQLYPGHFLPSAAEVIIATEDGTAGEKGVLTDLLPDFIGQADQVFACGPLPMYQAMAQMTELQSRPAQISLEVRMGCGRGVCYGCTVKTGHGLKQVCTDGPVFELDDILWDDLDW